jgi:hypothetical protein
MLQTQAWQQRISDYSVHAPLPPDRYACSMSLIASCLSLKPSNFVKLACKPL